MSLFEETYSLREARIEHAVPVAHLMNDLGYPTTAAEMTVRLQAITGAAATYHTLVAVRDDVVVGVIGMGLAHYYERNGQYARVLALSVREADRGAGVGTMLLRAAERWARDAGANNVFVNSGNHRADAHAFYLGQGYRQTGLRFVKSLVHAT